MNGDITNSDVEALFNSGRKPIPEYTTDPSADMKVLEIVRTVWAFDKVELFLGCLFETWTARTKHPTLLFLQYQPGDYAKAAVKAARLS